MVETTIVIWYQLDMDDYGEIIINEEHEKGHQHLYNDSSTYVDITTKTFMLFLRKETHYLRNYPLISGIGKGFTSVRSFRCLLDCPYHSQSKLIACCNRKSENTEDALSTRVQSLK